MCSTFDIQKWLPLQGNTIIYTDLIFQNYIFINQIVSLFIIKPVHLYPFPSFCHSFHFSISVCFCFNILKHSLIDMALKSSFHINVRAWKLLFKYIDIKLTLFTLIHADFLTDILTLPTKQIDWIDVMLMQSPFAQHQMNMI